MIIIHTIDDFLSNLFPTAHEKRNNIDLLKQELIDFYTYGPFRPKVDINGDLIRIEIDTSSITAQKSEFDAVVKHCEEGKFNKAKPILEKLIKKNPTVSEYHRILGQIYAEEGRQEEAINSLIDALRWDPRNTHALTMMGNIFAREKNDISTALSYYEHVLAVRPDDHIALNNIGANLLQLGKINDAHRYFEQALSINADYANTLYGLGMINDVKGSPFVAFDYAIQAMKKSKPGNPVYRNALEMAQNLGLKVSKSISTDDMFNQYSQRLAVESGKNIDIVEDNTIPTPAKFEMAENYKLDKHVLRFKKDRLAVAHLMMHELVHLDFAIQCRKQNANFLFITKKEQKELFIRENEPIIQKLNRAGFDDTAIAGYITALFDGINSQTYNTPPRFIYRRFSL